MIIAMMKCNDRLAGALSATLGGIGWGVSGSIGQYLFTAQGMDSRWLVPVRLGLAGIILLVYAILKNRNSVFSPWKHRRDIIDLLIYGIAGVSMCQYFYFRTIQQSSAAIATILQDLSPLFIFGATAWVEHKKPGRWEVFAVVLALFGVFLLSTHGDVHHLAIPSGALITGILSAVCVMIYNVYPRRLLSSFPLHVLQGWAFLSGGILFYPLFQAWRYYVPVNGAGLAGILFVVLIGNIVSFLCYMDGVKKIGPKKSILYGFSEPLSAALITVFVFHSPFGIYDVLGFVMIFAAITVITLCPDQTR